MTSDVKKECLTVKCKIKILGHKGDGLVNTVHADVHAHHPRTSSQQIEKSNSEWRARPFLPDTDRFFDKGRSVEKSKYAESAGVKSIA